MENILLVCAAGISTATLVKNMKASADDMDIEMNITSVGIAAANEAIKEADIVLLGPQLGYLEPAIKDLVEHKVPVTVIDTDLYANMDGKEVLNAPMSILANKK